MKSLYKLGMIGFPEQELNELCLTVLKLSLPLKIETEENKTVDIVLINAETGPHLNLPHHSQKIFILPHEDFRLAITAFRDGAADLLVKPRQMDELVVVLKNAIKRTEISLHNQRTLELAITDDVTGLFNQRKLLSDLDFLVERFVSHGESFTALFIDLDHFKTVNDEFGHLVGSKLLSDIAGLIRKVVKGPGLIYRYGGDEFVVLLPQYSKIEGLKVGEKLLDIIKGTNFFYHPNYHLSASIGVAHLPGDAKTSEEIVNIADRMMYSAKKSGRGKICSHSDFF